MGSKILGAGKTAVTASDKRELNLEDVLLTCLSPSALTYFTTSVSK